MKNLTYLAPAYYKEFSCKADKCRNTCCSGWRIPISKDEYLKLMTVNCSKDLDRRLQSAFVTPEYVSDECYRYVSFNWLGSCPIQDKGLCTLFSEKGESFIPKTCRLFPRSLKSVNGVNVANCSCSCERVVEMLYEESDLNLEEIQLDEQPQLTYSVSDEDIRQIKIFSSLIKDQSTTLAESIAEICQIINKDEFDKDFKDDQDMALTIAIDLFKRIAAADERLSAVAYDIENRYAHNMDMFVKDKNTFEKEYPDWMRFLERLINNSMIYECFPFVDERADKTAVYKGLCFCYGLLRLICIGCFTKGKEKLIDTIALLFHVIDHTTFYYNVSVLSENAAVVLKL